jgi:hypothetical protein
MIDIDDKDVVLTRRDAAGRFVIFTTTDVQPSWPLRWWVAVLDVGGDGIGVPVRIDATAAPDGWTAAQLVEVATARAEAEIAAKLHLPQPSAGLVIHLAAALRAARSVSASSASGDPVTFEAGSEGSRFGWTVARCGEHALPFCPDASVQSEGVTLEQLLILLDQLLADGAAARPHEAWLWRSKRHVRAALRVISPGAGPAPSTASGQP